MGTPAPRKIEDIIGNDLEVIAGSSHVENLKKLRALYPELVWRETPDIESEELLSMVWNNMIDFTIADSNEVALNRHYYPELQVAFDISKPEELSWAFPLSQDDSLYRAAVAFFNRIKQDGSLDQLVERYYGHYEQFDFVGARAFITHYYQRLPLYAEEFVSAAGITGLDWRLLAAIGYQESHWNPAAISPTGVRGIMMLTRDTASRLGVSERTDPSQSILGGANYLKQLIDTIPERIPEPDRMWMALAAYNIGFGHLEDARIITQRRGHDADKWLYVKESLPLLRRESWYSQTKHGYARGDEPVRYVENVRNYYDQLLRITEQGRVREVADLPITKDLLIH